MVSPCVLMHVRRLGTFPVATMALIQPRSWSFNTGRFQVQHEVLGSLLDEAVRAPRGHFSYAIGEYIFQKAHARP